VPATHDVQTRLAVAVQAVDWNWPAAQLAAHVLHEGVAAPTPVA